MPDYDSAAERVTVAIKARKGNGEDRDPLSLAWPHPLDLEALAEREPQAPRFVLADWMPCGYATLLAGHGGVGKSAIALHLAVCIAAGVSFFGLAVERRRVLYLSCEDREGVLHWRLARISAHLGVDLARLRGWLEVLDLVGRDSILWDRNPQTGFTATSASALLEERMRGREVLIVDGISDTFAGNENARADVKRFVNGLVGLVPPDEGAVLLVAHVNKSTAANASTTEGYSGSTAWHNACRARWYLRPETRAGDERDQPERTGNLLLELQKSNLGRTDQMIRFRWDEGAHLFVGTPVSTATAGDRAHRERLERDAILAALRCCPDPVPAATTGQRTAYHVLSVRPEFPDSLRYGATGRRAFWRQVKAMRVMGLLREESFRRADRHSVRVLVAVPEGTRAIGE